MVGSRPNIVFIISDDHARNAVGCYGSRYGKLTNTPLSDLSGDGVHTSKLGYSVMADAWL